MCDIARIGKGEVKLTDFHGLLSRRVSSKLARRAASKIVGFDWDTSATPIKHLEREAEHLCIGD
jgi:hypothetical protein